MNAVRFPALAAFAVAVLCFASQALAFEVVIDAVDGSGNPVEAGIAVSPATPGSGPSPMTFDTSASMLVITVSPSEKPGFTLVKTLESFAEGNTFWIDPLDGDRREATPGTTRIHVVLHRAVIDSVNANGQHVDARAGVTEIGGLGTPGGPTPYAYFIGTSWYTASEPVSPSFHAVVQMPTEGYQRLFRHFDPIEAGKTYHIDPLGSTTESTQGEIRVNFVARPVVLETADGDGNHLDGEAGVVEVGIGGATPAVYYLGATRGEADPAPYSTTIHLVAEMPDRPGFRVFQLFDPLEVGKTYYVDPLLGNRVEETPGLTKVVFVMREVVIDTLDGDLNHVDGRAGIVEIGGLGTPGGPTPYSYYLGSVWYWSSGDPPDEPVSPRFSALAEVSGQRLTAEFNPITADTTYEIYADDVRLESESPGETFIKFIYAPGPTDTEGPVTTVSLSGDLGENGWFVSDVTVSLEALDMPDPGGSGVASIFYRLSGGLETIYSAPFILSEEGTHELEAWAVDTLGNVGPLASRVILLDTTAPGVVVEPSGPQGEGGIYTGDVLISTDGSDGGSGVALVEYSLDGVNWQVASDSGIPLSDEGEYNVQVRVTDGAGNVSDPVGIQIRIDKTPPVTTISLDPSGPDGRGGFYVSPVTVTLSATDEVSGVALTEYSLDGGDIWTAYAEPFVLSADGEHTILARSKDVAGLAETPPVLATVRIDRAAPTVTIGATPAELWPPNGKTIEVTIDGTATDGGAGIESITFTVEDEYGTCEPALSEFGEVIELEASREGTDEDGRHYTITVTVVDKAGNTATATTTVVCPHDQGKSEKSNKDEKSRKSNKSEKSAKSK